MTERNDMDSDTERRVLEVVTTAVDELGGLGAMTRHRQLGLLPALVEASYIVVLHEEQHASEETIAEQLGVTRSVVESVFEAPFSDAMPRIEYASRADQQYQPHEAPEWSGEPSTSRLEPEYLAGAVAKFAYSVVQRNAVGTAR